jgi:hypothetical protein
MNWSLADFDTMDPTEILNAYKKFVGIIEERNAAREKARNK